MWGLENTSVEQRNKPQKENGKNFSFCTSSAP